MPNTFEKRFSVVFSHLQLFAESIPHLVWSFLPDGTINYANKRTYEYLGMTREEINQRGWTAALHPDDRQRSEEIWRKAWENEREYYVEYRVRRASDGAYRWHLSEALPVRDADGAIICWLGTSIDVHERRVAEDELRAEKTQTQRYLDIADVILLVLDVAGRVVMLNRKGYEVLEYPTGALLGKDWFTTCIHESDREALMSLFGKAIADGAPPVHGAETRVLTRSGKERFISWRCMIVRNEAGGIEGTLHSGEDVTERKKVERALRSTEQLRKDLLDTIPDPAWIKDREGRFLAANKACCSFWGVDEACLLGTTGPPGFAAAIAEFIAQDRKAMESGSSFFVEEFVRDAHGHAFWFETFRAPFRDAGQEIIGAMGIARDITDRKLAQHELQQRENQLRALASELSKVESRERIHLASLLHDNVAQSLALSKIRLQMLHQMLPPEQQQMVEEIISPVQQAIEGTRSLISQLSPPGLNDLGLAAALEWLVEEMHKLYGLSFSFESSCGRLPLTEDLRNLLYTVVRELLINTGKHAQASHTQVSMHRDGRKVVIVVEDYGIGFPAEGIGASRDGGFGLFSIRERLGHLGGRCELLRAEKGGARVEVSVPLAEDVDSAEEAD